MHFGRKAEGNASLGRSRLSSSLLLSIALYVAAEMVCDAYGFGSQRTVRCCGACPTVGPSCRCCGACPLCGSASVDPNGFGSERTVRWSPRMSYRGQRGNLLSEPRRRGLQNELGVCPRNEKQWGRRVGDMHFRMALKQKLKERAPREIDDSHLAITQEATAGASDRHRIAFGFHGASLV